MNIKAQIINVPISATTDFAKNSVGNLAEAAIHSVYNKTINLLINKEIFSLHPQNSYLTPVSFVTNFTLQQFQQISLLPQQTYLISFDYQHCAIFSSKLTACHRPSKNQAAFYAETAQQMLQNATTTGLCLLLKGNTDDLILAAFKSHLAQIETFYRSEDWEKATDTLTKLIGLGIGLTPSGDDFLCGFLSAFQYFHQTETLFYRKLNQKIQAYLDNTNTISRRFIECALAQQFSKALLDFWHLNENKTTEIASVKNQFENIGHSSGMDTLFGIYYACGLLLKSKQAICKI